MSFLDAARRKGAGMAAGMVEPGEWQGTEFGVNFGPDVVDGERVAAAADERAVRAETLGDRIAQAKETVVDAIALQAGGELLTGGNALRVVWRRIEVAGAYLVEIEHGIAI